MSASIADTTNMPTPAAGVSTPALQTEPQKQPTAKFSVVSNYVTSTSLIGELQNEGPDAANAEVIVLIKADGKVVGRGSCKVEKVSAGEKRAFTIAIDGSTQGKASVEIVPHATSADTSNSTTNKQ